MGQFEKLARFGPEISAAVYLRFGVLQISERQRALDSPSRDISEAIHDLLNRHNRESITEEYVKKWESDYHAWCGVVSAKLSNRKFFTESDQLHFDRLEKVHHEPMTGNGHLDWLISMLNLKFERLREIIKLVPQRPL